MLTLFTDGLRRHGRYACVLLFLLLVLMQGCATTGDPDAIPTTEAEIQDKSETISSWLPESYQASHQMDYPAPKVARRNLIAFAEALEAIRSGRFEAAEVLLQEITTEQPELAGPWVNLGRVYVSLERFDDARLAFKNAIKANPRSCHAYNQLGVLSRQVGDFQGAEELYQACLKQMPEFKDAYLNLGILYELYLGKLPEALAAYRQYQSLSLEPNRKVLGWVMDLERRLGV